MNSLIDFDEIAEDVILIIAVIFSLSIFIVAFITFPIWVIPYTVYKYKGNK